VYNLQTEKIKKLKEKADSLVVVNSFDEALSLYNEALDICEQEQHLGAMASIENAKGKLHSAAGNGEMALKSYDKAIDILSRLDDQVGLGKVYLNIAIQYIGKGHYGKAIKYLKKSKKIFKDYDVQDSLGRTYFNISSVYVKMQKYDEAVKYVGFAKKIYKIENMLDEYYSADINLAMIYFHKGEIEKGFNSLNDAEMYFERSGNINWILQIYWKKAKLHEGRAEFDEAVKYYNKCKNIYLASDSQLGVLRAEFSMAHIYVIRGDVESARIICLKIKNAIKNTPWSHLKFNVDRALASISLDEGNIIEAKNILIQTRKRMNAKNQLAEIAELELQLGNVYYMLGEFGSALKLLNKWIKYYEHMNYFEIVAEIYFNIASIYQDYGKEYQSIQFCQKARYIFEKYGTEPSNYDIYITIADYYCNFNKYDEAHFLCKKARGQIFTELPDREEAKLLGVEARIIAYHENYKSALELLDKAESLLRSNPVEQAHIIKEKAYLFEKTNEYGKAISAFKLSRRIFDDKSMQYEVANINLNLCRLYIRLEQIEKAKEGLDSLIKYNSALFNNLWLFHYFSGLVCQDREPQKAIQSFEKAIDIIEKLRINTDIVLGQLYFDDKLDPYNKLLQIYLKNRFYLNAIELSEKTRCRSVIDYLNKNVSLPNNRSNLYYTKGKKLMQNYHKYSSQLKAFERNIQFVVENRNNDDKKLKLLKSKKSKIITKIDSITQALNNLKERNLSFYAANYFYPFDEIDFGLEHVMDGISNKKDLKFVKFIYFHCLKNEVLIFILQNKEIVFRKIEISESELISIVNDINDANNSLGIDKIFYIPESLQLLSGLLIQKIKKYLMQDDIIVFIPHNYLNLIPFNALCYESTANGKKYLKYLIEDHPIVQASSLNLLLFSANRSNNYKNNAFIGGSDQFASELSYAKNECMKIAQLIGNMPYWGDKLFNLDTIKEYAPSNDIIHFACHGKFESEDLTNTGLIVSKGQLLDVESILSLELNSNLVVLNSCETGKLDISNGDNWLSFVRAFLKGSKSVIANLWKCEDEATMHIITDFYKLWIKKDVPKAQALQQAQINYIRKVRGQAQEAKESVNTLEFRGNYNYKLHPYFWAGLQLYGDWE